MKFKDYYDRSLARTLATDIHAQYEAFDKEAFVTFVSERIPTLEIKDRQRVFAEGFKTYLPNDYREAISILLRIMGPPLEEGEGMFEKGYQYMPLATFVELYGLEDFATSMQAIYEITQRHTSEFAIRPLIMHNPEQALTYLRQWVHDDNPHVRRLVSEGTRPRLPWATRLDLFIIDPTPSLALLHELRDDPSSYVRKSVANHLNDLSKDHPERILNILGEWAQDAPEERLWIIRHALRTLIKAGNSNALEILGYDPPQITIRRFALAPPSIILGENISLMIEIENPEDSKQELMIDYILHLRGAKGEYREKVFKLKSLSLGAGESAYIEKKHPIRAVTVRRYYPGEQGISLQINGQRMNHATFTLEIPD